MSELFDRIRIIPREENFLDRIAGSSGQIYSNKDSGSIRVYNGKETGGAEILRADFQNADSSSTIDLTSSKNKIRFNWATLSELESEVDPNTYAGMIAYVANEDRLYFANTNDWIPVANLAESGVDIPYTPDADLEYANGKWDFGQNIIQYANTISFESDLENIDPNTYTGMTLLVFETGALYYSHAGDWHKILTDITASNIEANNYQSPLGNVAYSNNYNDLDNSPQTILDLGILDGSSGQVLSTNGAGTFSFIDVETQTGSAFDLIQSDDGSFNPENISSLKILGGTNISTEVITDSDELTINLDSFSINFLSDVDTQSNPPATGEVLKWDGAKWAPGTDVAEGGSGLDADTLDGQDGSYYLDYNNFTNTPAVATLSDFSVGNELTASGNGGISYDNTTGVFRFTPPTPEGIGALTSVAFNDLTSTPTTIAGYGITDAFSGSFSDLDNKPTTISGYGITDAFSGDYNDLVNTPLIPQTITDLGIDDGTDGQVLTTDGNGNFSFTTVTQEAGGDPDQNLWETFFADFGSTTADNTADNLTISGGNDISTSISGDTLTIDFVGASGGVTDFSQLTDVQNANLTTIDQVYESAICTLRGIANGFVSYSWLDHYTGENPTIYAISGTTIAFDLSELAGHPTEIRTSDNVTLTEGLTWVSDSGQVERGIDAQGQQNGTLYWRINESISGNFKYFCTAHPGMEGPIVVKRLSQL